MSEETVAKGEWLLCRHCGGPIEFDLKTYNGKCDQCWTETNVREQTSLIEQTMSSLGEAIELIESKKRVQAEELLLTMQRQISDVAHPNSIYICAIKRELSRCHEELGQWHKAIEYRTTCLIITETVYGDKSVEMLQETKKMSDLYYEFIQSQEEKFQVLNLARSCLILTSKAAKLMKLYPEMVNELDVLNERLCYLLLLEKELTNICFPTNGPEMKQAITAEAENV